MVDESIGYGAGAKQFAVSKEKESDIILSAVKDKAQSTAGFNVYDLPPKAARGPAVPALTRSQATVSPKEDADAKSVMTNAVTTALATRRLSLLSVDSLAAQLVLTEETVQQEIEKGWKLPEGVLTGSRRTAAALQGRKSLGR